MATPTPTLPKTTTPTASSKTSRPNAPGQRRSNTNPNTRKFAKGDRFTPFGTDSIGTVLEVTRGSLVLYSYQHDPETIHDMPTRDLLRISRRVARI